MCVRERERERERERDRKREREKGRGQKCKFLPAENIFQMSQIMSREQKQTKTFYVQTHYVS